MHYTHNWKSAVAASLMILLFQVGFSQTKNDTQPVRFLILVGQVNEVIKLSSYSGCSWKELSFSLRQNETKSIDENGLTGMSDEFESQNTSLADFHITIKRTKKGVAFEGKAGTRWLALSVGTESGKFQYFIDAEGTHKKSSAD